MQNKWLMINIQNVQDFACQCLNRDVWSNEAVKNIIREHFIFWQVRRQLIKDFIIFYFYSVGCCGGEMGLQTGKREFIYDVS